MGWFWQQQQSPSLPPPPPSAASPSSNNTAATLPKATKPSGNPLADSQDREIQKFWAMLEEDTAPKQQQSQPQSKPPPPPPQQQDPSSKPSARPTSWFAALAAKPPPAPAPSAEESTRSPESLAMSESLLPETMSCRDAFDYAWHCHTVGSQWNAIYRYGEVRSCSDLWDDFWMCMRTRTFSPEQKAAAIKEHFRAREEAKYGGGKPSSEDVWQSRDKPLPPGTAFSAKFDPPIQSDLEYQKMQVERRRRIRAEMEIADNKPTKE